MLALEDINIVSYHARPHSHGRANTWIDGNFFILIIYLFIYLGVTTYSVNSSSKKKTKIFTYLIPLLINRNKKYES